MFPRSITAAAVCLLLLTDAPPARGCGFVDSSIGVTLRQDVKASKIVMYVEAANPRGNPDDGRTDLVILKVLKSDPSIEGKKVVELPRYITIPDPKKPPRFLVFADVTKGKPDFYRGIEASPAIVDYVNGAMAFDVKDHVSLMRYCFGYLDHPDREIAADAFHEFIRSPDPAIWTAARPLSPEKLRGWLRDERTRPDRLRLYAFLLASCGDNTDAALLRERLDNWVRQPQPPMLDGVLTAYTLLDPQEGWAYTLGLMKDPTMSFVVRYAGLRAARYFRTTAPGILTDEEILAAVSIALRHRDMADIPIVYLSEWQCWDLTGQILALVEKEGFDVPIIRRSILRYALRCPDPRAAEYVAQLRKTNPRLVEMLEEVLRGEAKPPAKP